MPNPWDNDPIVGTAPQQSNGPVYGPPPKAPAQRDPLQVAIDEERLNNLRNPKPNLPVGYRLGENGQAERIPGLPMTDVAGAPKISAKERADAIAGYTSAQQLRNIVADIRQKYAAGPGATSGIAGVTDFLPTEANKNFDAAGNAARGIVGQALGFTGGQLNTAAEANMAVGPYLPDSSNYDATIEDKIRRLEDLANQAEQRSIAILGGRPDVNGVVTPVEEQAAPDAAAPDPTAALQQDGKVVYDNNNVGEQIGVTQDATKTVHNPQLAGVRGEYLSRLQRGDGPGEIVQFLRSAGVTDPKLLATAVQQANFRRKNPSVPIEKYNTAALDLMDVPLSEDGVVGSFLSERDMNTAAQSPGGAVLGRMGNAYTANSLDSIIEATGGNGERARIALNDMQRMHPVASMAGDLAGGVGAAMTAEAGLARAGLAPGIARSVSADTGYGMAAGAGAADNGDRLQGAVQGGLAGLVGSIGGQAAAKGIGAAVSPTGGRLSDLYAEGVRPTPGQRFVNAGDGKGVAGTAGRMLNAAEEGLQSIPVVGSAIRGARQDARDQFQVGAFNQSLREIGDKLPKGMKPGPAAHKYANQKIGAVYDKAREGMRVMADEELANDIGTLGEQVGTLAEPSIRRFEQIIQNVVLRRTGEVIDGGAYKKIQSELGKIIRGIRKNPSGDGELADALQELSGSIDSAARRHSSPEAVAALDAADRAYAKLVRIEDASRGSEAGTFTPTQLAQSVRRNSERVRSKAYNQGDALMQDYAEQGMSLTDRMPNSGTADRVAIGTAAAGGAAYMEPTSLGVLGVISALYAPGMRKLTTGAMAPRGEKARAIADAVRKRKRLAGASGATMAVQGTSPDR